MKRHEEESPLRIRPRETEVVSITLPKDALASLKKVAAERDMSFQALLKLYIGQGLREDLTRRFGDRVLETAAHVLARHLPSEKDIASIMREIREEVTG
jgi:hypothetical protein